MEHVAINVGSESVESVSLSRDSDTDTTSTSTESSESRDQHIHVSTRDSISMFREAADELMKESVTFLKTTDLERAAEGEPFDLRGYFQDSNTQALKAGGKSKRMGVSIKNLEVVGQSPENSVIATNATPLLWLSNLFNIKWCSLFDSHQTLRYSSLCSLLALVTDGLIRTTKTPTTKILSGVNMFCKDGEMVLVLGRPGSGCSTLLRVIANMRDTFESITGDVNYGGIPANEFDRYRGEAIYTPEEDCHDPFLTLRETLDFALRCKTPGNRLPEETQKNFREKMIKLLTTMFGLQKQLDTLVGNEFLRGLSGGERKRLTLMEAMVTSASITSWDCGLDAASAFDYVQCLRVMTDVLHKTTICSFYQASESIYNLFDRVVVLDKGRVIYFGPTKDAKKYFLDLGFKCEPRKSTPDFLTGVTNPQERIIKKGYTPPETSYEFEDAWKRSKQCKRAIDEQNDYEAEIEKQQPAKEFKEEVREQKRPGARKGGVYTAPYHTQWRGLILKWRDTFSLVSRYSSILIQAFIYASVFFLMPFTDIGLYSRGGALFSALLFNAMLSISEMPAVFMGRLTLQKQKAYAMYQPSAFHLSQVVVDIPFLFVQCLLFSVITYWMFGLERDPNNFFIFLFVLMLSSACMTSFFRLLGNLTPSLFIAQQIQSVLLIAMIAYCGFIIPYPKMKPWFQWFYWINPLTQVFAVVIGAYSFRYCLSSLIINEISGNTFSCEDTAVPNGANYTNNTFRSCTSMSGTSTPGELEIIGDIYLQNELNYSPHLMALYVMVVVCYWIFFTVCNCIAIEYLEFTGGGYTKKVYKKGKVHKEYEKEAARIVKEATEGMGKTLAMRDSTFSWRHINYTVPVGGKEKNRQLLNSVDGWIRPGQMTALMGASGAGKTTLLDVLAQRKTIGKVEGELLLNGKPLRIDFERITGYVEQMDVFNPATTVLEALQFSAKLRQEPSVSLQEKYEYVEKVLEMMEMNHLRDALIGDLQTGEGISVEERKRLTIGMELVAKPHILFLDEPTSGLDAQSSYNIIKFVRKLADTGMPLVCTIHQPSSVLFEYFDRILLLAKGGKTVYFGDIGTNSRTLCHYFERNGVRKCAKEENPAEYILEAIGAGVNEKSSVDWHAIWNSSQEYADVQKELVDLVEDSSDGGLDDTGKKPREFATSQWYQFWEVYKRLNIIWWRSPFYNTGRIFNGLSIGLILGFSYFDLDNSASDLRSRIFLLFQSMLVGILLVFASMPVFYFQREFFKRDYASKFYSWIPFSTAIVLVEIPYVISITTVSFLTMYWTSGLNKQNSSDSTGYLWLFMCIFTAYCVAFGQSLASVCTHIIQAITLLPILLMFLFLFCGVLNPPSSMPYFWSVWAYPLMPTTYYLEGVVSNVLVDVQIECTPDDVTRFLPPPNITCQEYAAEWLETAIGYIINPNATNPELCGYCQYERGANYYEDFIGWSYDHRWRNVGIVVCYWFFAVLATVIFSYVNRKGMR